MNKLILPNDVLYLLNTLHDSGFEAYIVGGCVRDLVMGMEPHDYDITTNATPSEVHAIFDSLNVVDTGVRHGTVTVILNNVPYEITTYRSDSSYSDHRHPDSVDFSTSLAEDLIRRDFTINAMAYCPESGLVDLHDGIKDLENKVVRCVGDPNRRFDEDALRILRCIRFAGRLGFSIEKKTETALFENAHLLDYVSRERIMSEFSQILCLEDVEPILMKYREIFACIIPEIRVMFDFDQHTIHHAYDLWVHTVKVTAYVRNYLPLRLAALLHDLGKAHCYKVDEKGHYHFKGHQHVSAVMAQDILKRLKCSKALIQEITLLIENHDRRLYTETALRRALYVMGSKERMYDLLDLIEADNQAKSDHTKMMYGDLYYKTLVDLIYDKDAQILSLHDLNIKGDDLISFGLRGPEIGKALQKALDGVIEGLVDNNKDELLKYLGLIG